MGTSDETPKKSLAQKGQGMLEYALMMSFVAMVYLIVFADGGFGGAITGTFDNASETLVMASEKNSSGDFGDSSASGSSGGTLFGSLFGGGGSSSSGSSGNSSSNVVEHTIDEIAKQDYRPLNWQQVINDMKLTYDTITKTKEADKAIKSEYNLFAGVGSMVSGTLEYNYDEANNVQGWNDLMNQMGGQIEANNFTTSYVKGNESLDIKRVGDKVVMTYTKNSDTKEFSIYADKNKMHFESKNNSGTTKELNEALEEYTSIGGTVFTNGWQFASN